MTGLHFYTDAKDEFRWRVKGENGEIIGASSEGFKSLRDCECNLALVVSYVVGLGVGLAPIVDENDETKGAK